MSAPANTKIIAFSDRLPLVKKEVSKRLANAAPTNKTALQARLWCQWLSREVLS